MDEPALQYWIGQYRAGKVGAEAEQRALFDALIEALEEARALACAYLELCAPPDTKEEEWGQFPWLISQIDLTRTTGN